MTSTDWIWKNLKKTELNQCGGGHMLKLYQRHAPAELSGPLAFM